MSREGRLRERLAELARRPSGPSGGPALESRRGPRVPRAELLSVRDERRDPLTGHRGPAEGLHLLARAGDWLVDLQLHEERAGVVLRGQVLPAREGLGSPGGALVHLLAEGESFLACVDSAGEFVARGLPATTPDRMLLELESEVHEIPWPRDEPAP